MRRRVRAMGVIGAMLLCLGAGPAAAADAPSAGVADWLVLAVFLLGAFLLGLFGLLAPLWAAWRWRGGWRVVATVPGLVVLWVVLRIVFDTARDPTSHNLWPFELLLAGGASSVVMLGLLLARRFGGAQR